MSVYVRELLYDEIYKNTEIETSVLSLDTNIALKKMLKSGEITELDVRAFAMYLYGYSVEEIIKVIPGAYSMLLALFARLERETECHDESIINTGLYKYPKYVKIRPALCRYAIKMSLDLERSVLVP